MSSLLYPTSVAPSCSIHLVAPPSVSLYNFPSVMPFSIIVAFPHSFSVALFIVILSFPQCCPFHCNGTIPPVLYTSCNCIIPPVLPLSLSLYYSPSVAPFIVTVQFSSGAPFSVIVVFPLVAPPQVPQWRHLQLFNTYYHLSSLPVGVTAGEAWFAARPGLCELVAAVCLGSCICAFLTLTAVTINRWVTPDQWAISVINSSDKVFIHSLPQHKTWGYPLIKY